MKHLCSGRARRRKQLEALDKVAQSQLGFGEVGRAGCGRAVVVRKTCFRRHHFGGIPCTRCWTDMADRKACVIVGLRAGATSAGWYPAAEGGRDLLVSTDTELVP